VITFVDLGSVVLARPGEEEEEDGLAACHAVKEREQGESVSRQAYFSEMMI
jgi:hypothetical protein